MKRRTAKSPLSVEEPFFHTEGIPLKQEPDTLPPDHLARKNEDIACKKAYHSIGTKMLQAILAGAFIGIGGLFSTVAMSGDTALLPYGLTKVIGGLCFSLGLVMVVLSGGQLFTSDCLMVMPLASNRLRIGQMLVSWGTVWIGNFIGAFGFAVIVFMGGQYLQGHGAFGAMALSIASAKSQLPSDQAFFLGVLCNVLVCMAVWMANAARGVGDKIAAIILPVAGFIAAGGEHSVANMYFIPLGFLIEQGAPLSFWEDIGKVALEARPSLDLWHFLQNLGAVTLGNIVGGGLLVGGLFWMIYRKGQKTVPSPRQGDDSR